MRLDCVTSRHEPSALWPWKPDGKLPLSESRTDFWACFLNRGLRSQGLSHRIHGQGTGDRFSVDFSMKN
jgi:hypothetical protein